MRHIPEDEPFVPSPERLPDVIAQAVVELEDAESRVRQLLERHGGPSGAVRSEEGWRDYYQSRLEWLRGLEGETR